jgi:hypothetical protein
MTRQTKMETKIWKQGNRLIIINIKHNINIKTTETYTKNEWEQTTQNYRLMKERNVRRNKGNSITIMQTFDIYRIHPYIGSDIFRVQFWCHNIQTGSHPLPRYQSATDVLAPVTSISPTPLLFFNPYLNIIETPKRRRYEVREAPPSHRTCGTEDGQQNRQVICPSSFPILTAYTKH